VIGDPTGSKPSSPLTSLNWRAELANWPPDWREVWEERAAIMEYDANLPRHEAEKLAFEDVKRQMARTPGTERP
jgi:hypothetical protein